MAIPIEENVLLFLVGAIFIPFISLLIKVIIDMGVIKSKQEQVDILKKELDIVTSDMNKHENRLNLLESRVERLERQQLK